MFDHKKTIFNSPTYHLSGISEYKVVCLIGSLKFYNEFDRVSRLFEGVGIPFISPIRYMNSCDYMLEHIQPDFIEPPAFEEQMRIWNERGEMEDEVRLTKGHIDSVGSSDIVYVISSGGYVGKSTSVEIGVAYTLGKKIYSTERLSDTSVGLLVNGFLSPEELVEKIKSEKKNIDSERIQSLFGQFIFGKMTPDNYVSFNAGELRSIMKK